MNFDFSEDLNLLRDEARKFLSDQCSTRAVRRILEGEDTHDRGLWSRIAALGWLGTAIPEEYGGLGLGHEGLCVLAEELGRAIAPVPFASSVYLATEAILRCGTPAQKAHYLPKLAAGELVGCFALSEGTDNPRPAAVSVRLAQGRLDGVKWSVADGGVADFAVVVARDGGDDIALAVVDLQGEGVTRRSLETVDPTREHARLEFQSAPANLLGEAACGWEAVQSVLDRAAVLTAFEQVGGAQACLEMATSYAKERMAFGRPIGSFQAIKHKLADVYVATELARSNAYYGAWALQTDAPELPLAAATARVAASEAFFLAARENIQTHGGMGFTWDLDCHLFYRRAKLLSLSLGSPRHWKNRLVDRWSAVSAPATPV